MSEEILNENEETVNVNSTDAVENQVVEEAAETVANNDEAVEVITETVTNNEVAAEPIAETFTPEPVKTPTVAVAEKAAAHDDFDWDSDEAGFYTYSKSEHDDLAKAYTESFSPVIEKQVVTGTVVSINEKDVVLNIGFKSDGLVSRQEFRDMPDLKIGDTLEVFVDIAEDRMGQLILSRRKAMQETAWDRLAEALRDDLVVTGFVRSRTKGGLVVDVFGIDTFLPGSQIDTKPVRDYDQYVGKHMDFKIVKINDVYKNVVVSHKALIEDDIEAQKSQILGTLEKGQVLEGIVKNMTSFGVFVDLGGIDGLLHITDISWGRINHPEEVLKLEDKIQVVILDYDNDKKRISLGLKQLTPHPWDSLTTDFEVNSKVKGKVVSVADYGAFVEIMPGVEGLVHVSEMSWSSHLRNPSEYLQVGQDVDALILALDKTDHKMSLGIKQLIPDPWVSIEEKFAVGSKHSGVVKNLTSYGLFVEIEDGIDGLVHVSDLSWNKKIKHPSEFTKKGEKLDVVVLEVDKDNRRLSLGHKQLEENPWDTFETIFEVGTIHQGTITSINDKGANVQMQFGIEAFAPARHTKKQNNASITEDETLEFEVIEFSKDQKRIIISHTNTWKAAEKSRVEADDRNRDKMRKKASSAVKKLNQGNERSTLGELDALAELRAQLESAEKSGNKTKTEAPKKEAAPKKESTPAEEQPVVETVEAPAVVAETTVDVAENTTTEEVVNEIAATATDATEVEVAEEKPKKTAKAKKEGDDLKVINGIGPAFEKRLNALGISTFADLVALTDEKIAELETQDSMTSNEEWHAWIEEAKGLIK